MRTLRIWLALCCAVALVMTLTASASVAQVAPGNPFATDGFADASGGAGGSARGGDGGNGGSGTAPMCNQSTNDVFETDDWADATGPVEACGAGGLGGDAGRAGESVGGNGGIAFGVGPPPPPGAPPTPEQIRRLLADLGVLQRLGSFIINVANHGPDTAVNATLTANLSATDVASIDSVSTPRGGCTAPEGTGNFPITVTCQFGDIPVGDSFDVEIEWSPGSVCYPSDPNVTATSVATVANETPDPNLANNTSTLTQTKRAFCPE